MLGNQLRSYDPDRYALRHYPSNGNPHDTLDAIIALETEIRVAELTAHFDHASAAKFRAIVQEVQAMRDTRMALRARLMTQIMELSSRVAHATIRTAEEESMAEGSPEQLEAERADEVLPEVPADWDNPNRPRGYKVGNEY